MIKVSIIIASDTRSKGINKDESIPAFKKFLEEARWNLIDASIVPDEIDEIKNKILYNADVLKVDLILISGGTGFSKRDVTPEATRLVIEKEIPGFSEIMRVETFKKTKTSVLSRGISGIRGKTIIINLPGNPQGAIESLSIIKDIIPHGLEILQGKGGNNGRDTKGFKQD
jgi:molybdopterin adenylyltransferase